MCFREHPAPLWHYCTIQTFSEVSDPTFTVLPTITPNDRRIFNICFVQIQDQLEFTLNGFSTVQSFQDLLDSSNNVSERRLFSYVAV